MKASNNKLGRQTFKFPAEPEIIGAFAIGGEKEGQGPMGETFDYTLPSDDFGEKTWEKAESRMLETAIKYAIKRSGKAREEIDAMLCGDLINQLMSSSFMARDVRIPFLGIYGACSTMAESLILGSVLIDGGYADNVVAGASSHYCTAERQFRMPLEHGNQRPPSAQWTATAAGAVVLSGSATGNSPVCLPGSSPEGRRVCITCGTVGKVIDTGLKDVNQMGAAMAPAAVDSLLNHLEDTGRALDYYDLVLSGDLGYIGKDIMRDLLLDAGLDPQEIADRYDDCGAMMYKAEQDVHGGGSGCGCSASLYAGHIYKKLRSGELNRVLIMSTGALLSTISPFQGESIPGIAHCLAIEGRNRDK